MVSPAARAGEPCLSVEPERVWVESVRSADEIRLVDGRVVRLASIETPRVPLAASGAAAREEARLVAVAARRALADSLEGRESSLLRLGEDRWGRVRGHLLDAESGDWVQWRLVAAGLARIAATEDDRSCARALAPAEAQARRAGTGLWATAVFGVRRPEDLAASASGSRFVVEGTVRSVGHSGRRTYLNFGDDFRRDFAVLLDDKVRERLAASGFVPEATRGRRVLVRGELFHRDGPRMSVDVPEDIEQVKR